MSEPTDNSTNVRLRCPACGYPQNIQVTGSSQDGIKYSGSARSHCSACQLALNVNTNWTVAKASDH